MDATSRVCLEFNTVDKLDKVFYFLERLHNYTWISVAFFSQANKCFMLWLQFEEFCILKRVKTMLTFHILTPLVLVWIRNSMKQSSCISSLSPHGGSVVIVICALVEDVKAILVLHVFCVLSASTLACVCVCVLFVPPCECEYMHRCLRRLGVAVVRLQIQQDVSFATRVTNQVATCIFTCVFLCMWVLCGGSGVWIISPWAIFRAASQAWGREEKGGIVVVQMSVVGASENRFTHGGLTDTHLQQPPDPSDYDHASWTPFPIMKGLNQYVAYVGCNCFVLQYDC